MRLQELTSLHVKALLSELAERGSARLKCSECGGGVPRRGAEEGCRCGGRFVPSGRPLSAKTVHNIYRALCNALNDACDESPTRLLRNPAAKAHKMPPSPEQQTWSPDQLRQFFAHNAEDRWLTLWQLVADSAMRRAELAGLRWADLDLDVGRVRLATQRAKGAAPWSGACSGVGGAGRSTSTPGR